MLPRVWIRAGFKCGPASPATMVTTARTTKRVALSQKPDQRPMHASFAPMSRCEVLRDCRTLASKLSGNGADVRHHGRRYNDESQLHATFQQAGVDTGKPLIVSCGTGVTACVVALALDQLPAKPKVIRQLDPTEPGKTASGHR